MDKLVTAHIWQAVEGMLNNRLKNYIAPGLNSHLVGGENAGKVRLFAAERNTREFVTPHSHRFSFTALVLRGAVQNTIYDPCADRDTGAESWIRSTITQVCDGNGTKEYSHIRADLPQWYRRVTMGYSEGQTYHLRHSDIHSIVFDKGAKVLLFEGPAVQEWDWMLEPFVDGKLIPTFEVRPWMFERA